MYQTLPPLLLKALDSSEEEACRIMEQAGGLLAHELYRAGYISDIDSFLEEHVAELLYKSGIADKSVEELAEDIARREFEAFDAVKNEGAGQAARTTGLLFPLCARAST